MSFQDIPPEIQGCIVSFLNWREVLTSVQFVCKEWYTMAACEQTNVDIPDRMFFSSTTLTLLTQRFPNLKLLCATKPFGKDPVVRLLNTTATDFTTSVCDSFQNTVQYTQVLLHSNTPEHTHLTKSLLLCKICTLLTLDF